MRFRRYLKGKKQQEEEKEEEEESCVTSVERVKQVGYVKTVGMSSSKS